MHINKALYSVSYTCITAGAAGILFAGTYVLVRSLMYLYFIISWLHWFEGKGYLFRKNFSTSAFNLKF